MFGEESFSSEHDRDRTIVCYEDVEVLSLDKKTLETALGPVRSKEKYMVLKFF